MLMVTNGTNISLECYRHTKVQPYGATGEKPCFSYCLGWTVEPIRGCLTQTDLHPTDVDDYREEMKLAITSARKLGVQKKYKTMYDKQVNCTENLFQVGQWVLAHFPQER